MNVTEDALRRYVETFHATLDEVAGQVFSANESGQLLHKSLLPGKITCYLSTQLGVAFEYKKQQDTVIETVRGSSRIEDLVVGAPPRLRDVGPVVRIQASHITIGRLTFTDRFPFRLDADDPDVTLFDIRFECSSLNWSRKVEYAEVYADRRASTWTVDAARSRAKDEILAGLLLARRAKGKGIQLHESISSFQQKTVLVLGAYDKEGKKRLSRICEGLSSKGYEPLLIEDVPDFEYCDLGQKVAAVGSICRFVIIDDSTPSEHLAELEICRNHRWVTVVLREGDPASWMTAGVSIASNVILEVKYDSNEPQPALDEGPAWAEDRLKELKGKLNEIYPWRMES